MKTVITVIVTTPWDTAGVGDAIAAALDDPGNYPPEVDVSDWDVQVNDTPADAAEQVRLFLAEQLDRDDMTLAEIAAEAARIATGASEYAPADEDPDGTYTEDDQGNWHPVAGVNPGTLARIARSQDEEA